jgi:hypothetical protein
VEEEELTHRVNHEKIEKLLPARHDSIKERRLLFNSLREI